MSLTNSLEVSAMLENLPFRFQVPIAPHLGSTLLSTSALHLSCSVGRSAWVELLAGRRGLCPTEPDSIGKDPSAPRAVPAPPSLLPYQAMQGLEQGWIQQTLTDFIPGSRAVCGTRGSGTRVPQPEDSCGV